MQVTQNGNVFTCVLNDDEALALTMMSRDFSTFVNELVIKPALKDSFTQGFGVELKKLQDAVTSGQVSKDSAIAALEAAQQTKP